MASPVAALTPAQSGGAQSMVCDLALELTRRGHGVELHCAEGSEVPGVDLVTVPAPEDAAQALVKPLGGSGPPAPGVARAINAMLDAIATRRPDVISQHAFDAPAFRDSHGLPVLHTLHLPPSVAEVVRAAARIDTDHLATVSASNLRAWATAGVHVGRVLRNGVED